MRSKCQLLSSVTLNHEVAKPRTDCSNILAVLPGTETLHNCAFTVTGMRKNAGRNRY